MQHSDAQLWPKGVPQTLPVPQTSALLQSRGRGHALSGKTALFYYGGRLVYRRTEGSRWTRLPATCSGNAE